jgi:peptidoglycan/LPS O-acetylase OafA/YrhL
MGRARETVSLLASNSPWAPALLLILLFALAATPLFRPADSPPIAAGRRVSTLDGLRGFLALSVFIHHTLVYRTWLAEGVVREPADRLYAFLGPFGVSQFFMITGFLFWSQVVARSGKPDWVALYIGRIFRIGPLFLAAVAIMLVIVFAITGGRLHDTPLRLGLEIASWAVPLGFHYGPPVNGYAGTAALMGVLWTLRYEWLFYASLIVTALAVRWKPGAWVLPAVTLVAMFAVMLFRAPRPLVAHAPFAALFCVGMLVASRRMKSARFETPLASAVGVALVLFALAVFRTAYAVLPICVLGAFFFLVANGTSLFGLLVRRPARRLGNVSYGIYLLHVLVLVSAFQIAGVRPLYLASPLGHWLVVFAVGVVLVALATLTHALVERPGVELGRRAQRWARRLTGHHKDRAGVAATP